MGELTRIESGDATMLYDPSCAGNFGAHWFEPTHWQSCGAIRGTARGRGNTVFFEDAGHQYALRHYRRGGLIARVLADRYRYAGLELSRPWRELQLTHALHVAGLPVPQPIAARVVRAGAWYRGDFITRRLTATRTLAECLTGYLAKPLASDTNPAELFAAVGRCIARFHRAGVHHADLNAHNVLIDTRGEVFLIDFDRGEIRSPGWWQDANLVRLRRSILKVCDALPAVRFDETLWTALYLAYRETRDAAAEAFPRVSR